MPKPTIDEANKLNLDQWCFETDYSEYNDKTQKAMREFLPYVSGGMITDLGCGDGAAEEPVLESGIKYFGIDINFKKLARVKTGKAQDEMYAWLKKQPNNSVENIFCHHSLEHTANPSQIVTEIGRVLKPGGVCFLEVPSEEPQGCHVSYIKAVEELIPKRVEVLHKHTVMVHDSPEMRVIFRKVGNRTSNSWLKWDEVSPYMDHKDGGELIYEKALEWSKKLPEDRIFLEIGSWKGGTSMAIMQAIKDSGRDRWMMSVDPYGTKPFKLGMGIQKEAIYDETIYQEAMCNMFNYAKKLGVNYYHWRLTSDDFMLAFPNIKFWYKGEIIKPTFGFAYIDGDHNCYTVEQELTWLEEHMDKGMIVMDDVPYIDMNERPIIKKALAKGFIDNFRCYYEV